MRVLYITLENLSLHKGSVVHIKEIISGLRKLGHQVGLIACSTNQFEKADSFYNLHKFSRVKKQSYIISSLFLFIYLLQVLPKYDVIYARDYHTVIIALIPRLIFKKRLIFEINGLASEEQRLRGFPVLNQILAFLIQKAERIATRYSDRIVSVTPQIRAYLTQHFNCSPNKVEVIGNGVNTKIFCPILDEALLLEWKNKLGIAKGEPVVIFVGNLAPWQGVDFLLESGFRLLMGGEKLKFIIVGDGRLKKNLMRKVLESNFEKEFIFTGMVDYRDIPFFINIADICIAPFISKRNCKTGVSPLKIFEYMACGKPIIASGIEGLEFIEIEGIGRLSKPEDAIGLGEILRDLLKDDEKRINMGRKALRVALEKFTWDSKVMKIENLLKGLA